MNLEATRSVPGTDGSGCNCRRGGLTLVEVILVLALLVVIGAVSAPIISNSFTRAELQHSGDLLRAAWMRARIAAAEAGETRVFRFEPGGNRYQITSLDALAMPDSDVPEPSGGEGDIVDLMRLGQSRLPQGVVFAHGEVAGSNQLAATLPGTEGGGWSTPILFHPDGRTSDASVVLANGREQTLRVTLRGLTGISSAGEVGSEVLAP